MKIDRQKLVDILTAVKPGLAKKAIVEQSTHFIMTGEEILTYNDQICILYPFKTDFTCSIVAEEFYKILSGISQKEIDLSFKGEKLHIKAEGLDAGLSTDTGEDIMDIVRVLDLDKVKKKKTDLPADFMGAITLCMFSASKNAAANPSLTCLFIEDEWIVSTDGHRISEYKMKSIMDCSILVPAAAAMELVKFNVKKYAIGAGWIFFFTSDGIAFCSKLVVGEFPDYANVMKDFDKTEIVLPKDIKQMIATSSVLAAGELDQDRQIKIEIEKNKFRCRGQNEQGWVQSEKKFEYKGDDISFSINPFFLDKILDHTKSMFYGENRVLFKDKSFKHVIALMRPRS
jgi:DNA polymerase III sliding clamp (beta) subunit (PCNA family)